MRHSSRHIVENIDGQTVTVVIMRQEDIDGRQTRISYESFSSPLVQMVLIHAEISLLSQYFAHAEQYSFHLHRSRDTMKNLMFSFQPLAFLPIFHSRRRHFRTTHCHRRLRRLHIAFLRHCYPPASSSGSGMPPACHAHDSGSS